MTDGRERDLRRLNPAGGCWGKEKLPDRRTAQQIVKRRERRHEGNMVSYRCQHCDGWHIAHRDKGPVRR